MTGRTAYPIDASSIWYWPWALHCVTAKIMDAVACGGPCEWRTRTWTHDGGPAVGAWSGRRVTVGGEEFGGFSSPVRVDRPVMIPDEAPELRAVQDRFAMYPGRYWIAGGWAVDLHVGRVRREHSDVDVLILARDLHLFHAAFGPVTVRDHQTDEERPWVYTDKVVPGRHTLHFADAADPTAIEVVIALSDGDEWVFHRGQGTHRPLAEISHSSPGGVPYLGPEVVLMLKARDGRAKDDDDFSALAPLLTDVQRQWLIPRLTRPGQPEHPWLAYLTDEQPA